MTTPRAASALNIDRDDVVAVYLETRRRTNALCEPLSPEDMTVQVAAVASPAKWHLAHTTWFFETFVLERFEPNFAPYDPCFPRLSNSY